MIEEKRKYQVSPDSQSLGKGIAEPGMINTNSQTEGESKNNLDKSLLSKSDILQLTDSPVVDTIIHEYKENRVFAHCLTADLIIDNIAVLWDSNKNDIIIWNQSTGLYEENCIHLIEKLVYRINRKFNKYDMNEIISKIKLDTAISNEDYYSLDYKIPLNKGIYDIKTKKLILYSPEIIVFERLNLEYNPDMECPEILKFLDQMLPGKKDQELLFQYIGYCFHPANIFQKALLLFGKTRSGKSTIAQIISTFFLKDQKSHISLHKLLDNPFSKSVAGSRHVNFSQDMDKKILKNIGEFKTLVGDSEIDVEAKFKDTRTVKTRVKLICITNDIPYVYQNEPAFFNKWLFLNFKVSLEEKKQDKFLLEKLLQPNELSGFLNLIISHYDSLIRNRDFCQIFTEKIGKEIWLSHTNHIDSYILINLTESMKIMSGKIRYLLVVYRIIENLIF